MESYNQKIEAQTNLRNYLIINYKNDIIEFIEEMTAYTNIDVTLIALDNYIDPKTVPNDVVALEYCNLHFAAQIDGNGLLLEPQRCHHQCDGNECDYYECIIVNPLLDDYGIA